MELKHLQWSLQRCEVLKQQPMNEEVASAYLAKQDALSGVVQKAWIVPWHRPPLPEEPTQDHVLNAGHSTCTEPANQPNQRSNDEPIGEHERPEHVRVVYLGNYSTEHSPHDPTN